jgi:predicted RNA-binding protein with PUA-like domain
VNYWLLKTEPSVWSWQDQMQQKTTHWNGVRNYQAANSLKAMKIGDWCFFYHSQTERKIVGIVEVIHPWQSDPSDKAGRFGMVEVKLVKSLDKAVPLQAIKAEPRLADLFLVRQSRLSVMPINKFAWDLIMKMGSETQ